MNARLVLIATVLAMLGLLASGRVTAQGTPLPLPSFSSE